MAENYDYDLLVIGSGPAGQAAAIQASKLRRKVAIIERESRVGGVCTLTGTIPSKTLREAILQAVSVDSRGTTWHTGSRPKMSELLDRVREVMHIESAILRDKFSRNDVEVIPGEASLIDEHRVAVLNSTGNQVYSALNIMIAVGTTPAQPPQGQADGRLVLTSDDLLSLKALPNNMAVVGGGVIGVEYASIFATAGVHVTLIDRHDSLLDFVDDEVVDELMHQLRKKDITFRLGEAVSRIEVFDEGRPEVELELESGKRIIADCVLFSIGRVPATSSLHLSAVGIALDKRGRIPVNNSFQTEVESVYAAGDVIGFPALAATSLEQGRIASCRMFGYEVTDLEKEYPYGIYAIPEISMCGATEEELTQERTPYEVGVARYREIARGQIMGDDSGMFKMLFHRDTRKLLGVHCIGTGATELIHIGQAVLRLGGGLDYFLESVFNYPTLAEVYKVAAHNAANRLRHVRSRSGENPTSEETPVVSTKIPQPKPDPRPSKKTTKPEEQDAAS
jgi:NAD(P) transhydrogenase